MASPLDAARAFGVVFGGPALLDAAAAWSLARTLRDLGRGRRPPLPALAGTALTGLYAAAAVPWMRTWGATAEEAEKPLPGDELVPDPLLQTTRAVTIHAPVEQVWPWLAQMGQDRGGFYSYEWLENLAGCRMRNAERIHAEWQHRETGETVYLHWAQGMPVARFEPDRVIALEQWGAFVVEPLPGGRTRLLIRGRVPRAAAPFYVALVEIPHFVMERRMLLGIAERAARKAALERERPAERGPFEALAVAAP